MVGYCAGVIIIFGDRPVPLLRLALGLHSICMQRAPIQARNAHPLAECVVVVAAGLRLLSRSDNKNRHFSLGSHHTSQIYVHN